MSEPTVYLVRPYTRAEILADSVVHVLCCIAAVVAAPALLAAAIFDPRAGIAAGTMLYVLGLMAMLACSALYNTVGLRRYQRALRALDHSAIFVMIAGTYSPFALALGGPLGIGVLVYVWTVAVFGIVLQLLWLRLFNRLAIGLYLAMGWTVVPAFGAFFEGLPGTAVALVIAGGLVYTAGVLFHRWHSLRYQNAIWHGFVGAAAACHFVAIYLTIQPSA